MEHFFDNQELLDRIDLNFNRFLDDPYYTVDGVFAPHTASWPGDKEGRALLAYVSHYKINGRKAPSMDLMIDRMKEKTNEHFFFGPLASDVIFEQQLSGHSWLLRGLCEYYEQFRDARVLTQIQEIFRHLYLPTKGRYKSYPVERGNTNEGGVSGNTVGIIGAWNLSTDVGCAFMGVDGLSHAYGVTGDPEIKALVDEMIDVYLAIDKVKLKVQTHCTLTAARGMMRMYSLTGEEKYLSGAKEIYELYVFGGGMTLTYQNANWWGRYDTWTEPCAIVDSMMLALQLYFATGEEAYRRLAARVYHNGFAAAQRDNGGAGTDTVVVSYEGGCDTLVSKMYEAYFCCTMRLAEGLWFADAHKEHLYAEVSGEVVLDENGVYRDGDLVYAETVGGEEFLTRTVIKDGRRLSPLLKYYRIPKARYGEIKQRVLFN